ncbi:hypothetical protein GCM10028808_74480 [Spirosoma migulaei]
MLITNALQNYRNMKKVYLFVISILISGLINLFGQQKKGDSLLRENPAKSDTARVRKLLDMAGYFVRTDSNKVKQYTLEAIELAKQNQFDRGELRGYLTLSETACYYSVVDRAIYWVNVGFERYPNMHMVDDLYARLLYMKAELFYKAKQYNKAETLLLKAQPLIKQYSYPDHLISIPLLLGSIYMKKGKLAEAQKLLESAYQCTETAKNAQYQQEITHTLYKLYKKQGNYPKALAYYEKNVQLRDSLFSESNMKELTKLSTKYETEKKEQSIQALETEKKNQRLLIVTLFSLMGVGGGIFWQRAKTRNLQNQLLKQQNQLEIETRRLAEADIESKDRELVTNTMLVEQKSQILYDIKNRLLETQRLTEEETVKHELKKMIRHIDQNLSNDESWENFMAHFEAVHPLFFTKLQTLAPDLSALELKQCAYAKMNLTQKQVATLININADSVNVARFRIKKKLQLEKEESLVSFLQSL